MRGAADVRSSLRCSRERTARFRPNYAVEREPRQAASMSAHEGGVDILAACLLQPLPAHVRAPGRVDPAQQRPAPSLLSRPQAIASESGNCCCGLAEVRPGLTDAAGRGAPAASPVRLAWSASGTVLCRHSNNAPRPGIQAGVARTPRRAGLDRCRVGGPRARRPAGPGRPAPYRYGGRSCWSGVADRSPDPAARLFAEGARAVAQGTAPGSLRARPAGPARHAAQPKRKRSRTPVTLHRRRSAGEVLHGPWMPAVVAPGVGLG